MHVHIHNACTWMYMYTLHCIHVHMPLIVEPSWSCIVWIWPTNRHDVSFIQCIMMTCLAHNKTCTQPPPIFHSTHISGTCTCTSSTCSSFIYMYKLLLYVQDIHIQVELHINSMTSTRMRAFLVNFLGTLISHLM